MPLRQRVDRGAWNATRFGVTPTKIKARLTNRSEPAILLNSLPKSGTHLLERLVCLHPRLYRRIQPTVHEDSVERLGGIAKTLPRKAGEVTVAHLMYDDVRRRHVEDAGVGFVMLVRDPRDLAVSMVHHVATRADHPMHARLLARPTFVDRLGVIVGGLDELPPFADILGRFTGWLDGPGIVVRFEDLVGERGGGDDETQRATTRRVFDHLGVVVSDDRLDTIRRATFSNVSPTFRKGTIGGWTEVNSVDTEERARVSDLFASLHAIAAALGYETT